MTISRNSTKRRILERAASYLKQEACDMSNKAYRGEGDTKWLGKRSAKLRGCAMSLEEIAAGFAAKQR